MRPPRRRRRTRELDGWRATEQRHPAGTIDAAECVRAAHRPVDTSEAGARQLGHRYFLEVRSASRGLVQARQRPDGVELRLLGRGPMLLHFAPAEIALGSECVSCRYRVVGGLLARSPGGALTLSQGDGEQPELCAAVSRFAPRLGRQPGRPAWSGAPYELQRRAHVAISRRYLARLLAETRR